MSLADCKYMPCPENPDGSKVAAIWQQTTSNKICESCGNNEHLPIWESVWSNGGINETMLCNLCMQLTGYLQDNKIAILPLDSKGGSI